MTTTSFRERGAGGQKAATAQAAPSGFFLRLPDSLRTNLVAEADHFGLSANQYIVMLLKTRQPGRIANIFSAPLRTDDNPYESEE